MLADALRPLPLKGVRVYLLASHSAIAVPEQNLKPGPLKIRAFIGTGFRSSISSQQAPLPWFAIDRN